MGSARIGISLLMLCSQILAIRAATNPDDVATLHALKSSWQKLPPNWNGPDPCTGWEGITCNNNSRVIAIRLAGMGLIASEFGDIPSFSELMFLDLSNNKDLKGTLPPSIGNLKKLINLMLVGCGFFGPIPESIGSLKQLVFLGLNSNRFLGPIPPSIGNLSNLSWLDLSDNNLRGTIPVSSEITPGLDMLVKAKHFHLSKNQLSGTIPAKLFSSKMNLIHILLERTQLQGQIPSNLFSLPQLETVTLSNNYLNGTLDVGTSNTYNLTVDLQNNSIRDFNQRAGYNMNLTLKGNPICDGTGATERFCRLSESEYPKLSPNCDSVVCGSDKILSETCRCAYPYTGTLHFFSYSFSDLGNLSYYRSLQLSLMSAFQSSKLPVDSVSLSIPIINVDSYLQFKLQLFPSGQDYFNRTGVSDVGYALNRQLFLLDHYFGPFYFLDESYRYFSGKTKSSNVGVIVGATIGCSVLILLLISAGLYAFHQKKRADRARQKSPFASWNPDKSSGSIPQLQGAKWFSFEELKKCTNNFSEESIIGSGGYGKVYKGTLATGQSVAIKRAQQGSLQGDHEFKTEIELLSRIHHKNVVSLVGFCYEQGEQMLIYEYISNGNLKESLTGESGIRLDWMRRINVAFDSARGLAYMHELANPPIIHRDIKSNNILLDDHLNAKVADFGLSKPMSDFTKGYITTQVKGTLGYLDPEYYMTQQLTEKSDVYSFGIVMLELLTARPPIQQGRHIVKEVKEAMDESKDPLNFHKILDPKLGSGSKLGGLDKFVALALKCVEDLGAARPTMSEVVREIESIIQLARLKLDTETTSNSSSHKEAPEKGLYNPYGNESFFDHSRPFVPFDTELR